MFTPEERDRVGDRILDIARSDDRVVAAAVVGSLALDEGDRYSDIDLTFAVRDGVSIPDVLDDWTKRVTEDLGAVRLFDLERDPIVYRVFLLPDCLQLDVSFSPAASFNPTSPRFRLLYGEAGDPVDAGEALPATELLGWASMYARDVRVSIERGEVWRAENSLEGLRHYALSFACRVRDLPSGWGKGHDRLPADVLADFVPSLAASVEPAELSRALTAAIAALRKGCAGVAGVPPELDAYLADLAPERA